VEDLEEWWGGVGWIEATVEGVVAECCIWSENGKGFWVDKLSGSRQEIARSSTVPGRTTA
jgi:hypothetical protein